MDEQNLNLSVLEGMAQELFVVEDQLEVIRDIGALKEVHGAKYLRADFPRWFYGSAPSMDEADDLEINPSRRQKHKLKYEFLVNPGELDSVVEKIGQMYGARMRQDSRGRYIVDRGEETHQYNGLLVRDGLSHGERKMNVTFNHRVYITLREEAPQQSVNWMETLGLPKK